MRRSHSGGRAAHADMSVLVLYSALRQLCILCHCGLFFIFESYEGHVAVNSCCACSEVFRWGKIGSVLVIGLVMHDLKKINANFGINTLIIIVCKSIHAKLFFQVALKVSMC